MRKKLIALFILIVCLGLAGSAASETSNEGTDVYTLGEVVVTGGRLGVEAVATQREITAEEIEKRNVKTLDKALALLPGVDVRSGAQGIPRVNIRGLRSRHVLLLLNGIPINSTSDGQFNPAIIPTENIAKIKISYGGSSVLYGQGALGGVINIITKKGREGFRGSVSGQISEGETETGQMSLSGGKGKFDAFVSGSVENSDGYRLSDDFTPTPLQDSGLRDNSYSKREDIFGNAGYTINDDWKLGITLEDQGGNFGSPPSTLTKTASDPFAKNPNFVRIKDYDGNSAQFSAAYDPDSPFELRTWAFYNRYEEESARYDDATYSTITAKNGYYTNDETKITGGNIQGVYDFGSYGFLTASLATEQDEFHSVGAIILAKNGPLVPYDNKYEVDIHSAALEYDVLLCSKLDLVAGYSHYWQEKKIGEDEDKGSALLGARYQISDNTHVRASVSRKIRFPSLSQLYDANNGGNMTLRAEKSTDYELGVTRQLPWGIEADLVGFLNDVKNYIKKDVNNVNQNHDNYRFKGIELTLQKPFLDTGLIRVGYTYMDSEDRSANALTNVLEYDPKHKFTLEGSYAWSCGLSAYASFRHVADQYFLDDNGNSRKLGNNSLVDVKLEQRILKDRLYAYIGCENLFDENYEQSYGFPQAGRTAYTGLKLTF